MSIVGKLSVVRKAQLRADAARNEWNGATTALLARSVSHPLTTVGIAAGTGVVLGGLNVRPWRVPGIGMLLSGGLGDLTAIAMRLFTDFGIAGLGPMHRDASDHKSATEVPVDSSDP